MIGLNSMDIGPNLKQLSHLLEKKGVSPPDVLSVGWNAHPLATNSFRWPIWTHCVLKHRINPCHVYYWLHGRLYQIAMWLCATFSSIHTWFQPPCLNTAVVSSRRSILPNTVMQLLYCEILEKGFSLSRSPIYPGIPFLKLPTETTTHTQSWEGDPAIAVSYRLAEKILSFAQEVKDLGTLLVSG